MTGQCPLPTQSGHPPERTLWTLLGQVIHRLVKAWVVGSTIGLMALAGCILVDAPLGIFYALFSWALGV